MKTTAAWGSIFATIIAATLAMLASDATADPTGTIVFSRNGVVQLRDAATSADPRQVDVFGDGAALDWLQTTPTGTALIAGRAGRFRRFSLETDATAPPSSLLCWTAPRLSLDGRTVLCASGSGAALVARGHQRWLVRGDGARAGWIDSSGAVVVIVGDEIIAQPATGGAQRLAPHAPSGALSVSPAGDRAVGVYIDETDADADEGDDALYTFRLDGTGVRRKLMRSADPIAWSTDGAWVLVQQQREACLVRAVGGEYKCWNRYQAAAIAPSGQYALLTKPADKGGFDLYRVELAGASRSRPVKIESDIDGPAAWFEASPPAPARSTP